MRLSTDQNTLSRVTGLNRVVVTQDEHSSWAIDFGCRLVIARDALGSRWQRACLGDDITEYTVPVVGHFELYSRGSDPPPWSETCG